MKKQKSKSKSLERNLNKQKVVIKKQSKQFLQYQIPSPEKDTPIKLGVCAMTKKIQAKPMQQILKRLTCRQIQIIIIDDKFWQIQTKNWPVVHVLICFYSDGFPYMKAWKYVQLTKPFLINDLDKQQMLWDRTFVYSELKKYSLPTSRHYFVCRKQQTISQFYKRRNSQIDPEVEMLYTSAVNDQLQHIQQKQDEYYEQSRINNHKSPFKKKSVESSSLSPRKKQKSQTDWQDQNAWKTKRYSKKANQSATKINFHYERKNFNQRKSTATQIITRSPINIVKQYFLHPIYQNYDIVQKDDCIIIGTHKLKKPFVQKPFDAQNHEVCIYYPEADGGGRKILFRKKQNCSSNYEPTINNIRTQGNYLYQQFQRTDGFDIKVYTVGPYYMYAEARKAPSLDGVVQRNQNGKEKRYPVVLTPQQKLIAQKIVQVFKQNVCGFDLLRSNGKSYVCDVNGWSFVKGNSKYYDDCSLILKKIILEKFLPGGLKQIESKFSQFDNFMNYIPNQFKPPTSQVQQNTQQLRSVVAIFRHGDRNPKQKMKLFVNDPRFLEFFDHTLKQIKLKDPKSLTKLLDISNSILSSMKFQLTQNFLKLVQLKSVLQIGGHFQGLNRKVQLKAIDKQQDPDNPNKYIVKSALLILKWGGQLTKQGQLASKQLGKFFRINKYPYQQGLISLHSSYKHDLKTYSSEQGRCIKTAAAFLQGFLDLQGDLAPIINSMINRQAKAQMLLDYGKQQHEHNTILIDKQKQILEEVLNSEEPLSKSLAKYFDASKFQQKMKQIINKLQNPRAKLELLYEKIKQLTSQIAQIVSMKQSSYYINPQDVPSRNNIQPQQQSLSLMYKRWYKLQKDLYNTKKCRFNISKIPDIYDSINYDISHNKPVLEKLYSNYKQLFQTAQILAYFVVPNEYGVQPKKKLDTAKSIVTPLCKKIFKDLMFWKGQRSSSEQEYWKYTRQDNKQWRHVRTRLYFTSSSHIYSIFHILTLGNRGELLDSCQRDISQKVRNITYIGYLAHIDLRLYQNLSAKQEDPKRFRLQLSFNPNYDLKNPSQNKKLMLGHSQFTIQQIETFFKTVLGESWLKQETE